MPADSGPPGLAALVASTLGRQVTGGRRRTGGSKKGAYRLRLDDGGSVVGYVWDESEDWWATVRDAETAPATRSCMASSGRTTSGSTGPGTRC